MSEFVLHRNHTLRSLSGHIINFVKDVPVYVPPVCRKEAVMIGAEPLGDKVDPLGDEVPEVVELTPDERREQLVAAFAILQERNSREDFTGQGVPSVTALKKIVEFSLDKKEVEAVWRAYIESSAE